MRTIFIGLAVIAALYVITLILAYSFQRSLMYFPDQQEPRADLLAQTGFSKTEIEIKDIGTLTSLWKAPANAQAPILIHFHGNAGSVGAALTMYQELSLDGAGVLAVGYPGYGGNPGHPSQDAFFATATANHNWLSRNGIAPERVVIVGQSIGSGPAVWLAEQVEAAGLILEAPFTATDDIAASQFPFLPARLLMKDRFRNIERIGQIEMPLVWIHGSADTIISYASGKALFNAAAEPKTARTIIGAGHNDLWVRGAGEIIRAEAHNIVRVNSSN